MSSETPTLESPVSPPADLWTIPPERMPNLEGLITEDRVPVDNPFAEKLHRLLTHPLYASWTPPEGQPFLALANVGLFFQARNPALAPDVMLSLGVQFEGDLFRRENRSYFVWELGKVPDVIIEIVSDRRGGEEHYKHDRYANIGVPYYVIFDPQNLLRQGVLRAFELQGRTYRPLQEPFFPSVQLGLRLWEGTFEGVQATWLRWCNAQGEVIPTGEERAEKAEQRAEKAEQRLIEAEKRLAEESRRRQAMEQRLRELGESF